MKNSKIFGKALAAIRKEAGFTSAYHFFNCVEGSKSLGFSYVSYWDIERGRKLPKSWRLKPLIAALGLDPVSPKAKELLRAYFKALSGSDELVDMLSGPAAAPAADLTYRELAEAATHQALAQRTINLPLKQWREATGDMATILCDYYLFNTAGWVTVKELAAATKFKTEAVRKALKASAKRGYLEFSGDKARCLYTDFVVLGPSDTTEAADTRASLRRNWKTWLADTEPVAAARMTARLTKANLEIYRQHLQKAVNLVSIYEDPKADRQDSEVYYIDASIFNILKDRRPPPK